MNNAFCGWLLAGKTWVRRPARGSAETLAMFQGSHVGLSRVWILSVRGANCSRKNRSEFVVFFEGFKYRSVAFVLVPLLSCGRRDFRGVGVVICKRWRRFRLRCKRSHVFCADVDVLLLSGKAGDGRLQFATSFFNVQLSGGANDCSDTNLFGTHAVKRIPGCFLGIELEGSRAFFHSKHSVCSCNSRVWRSRT